MKKTTLGIFGISALGLALVSTGIAQAANNDSSQNTSMARKNFDANRHAEMQQILETTDYNSWKELVSADERGNKMLEVINESNFPKLLEMHKLIQAGDKDGADAIREELGLKQNGKMGRGPFDKEAHEAVRTALENADYSAWKTAIAQMPNAENMLAKITENNFAKLVEMHKLMQAGDRDSAETIREDLGLEKFGMGKGGMMRGGKHFERNNSTSQN